MKNKIPFSINIKSVIIQPLAVAFLFSFFSCQSSKEDTIEKDVVQTENLKTISITQFKNMGLEFADMSTSTIAETISANGTVDVPPENVAMVSLPVNGFIKTLTHNVLPGKYVTKGSVLATAQSMEAVQLQQDFLEKYTQNDFLKKEFDRQKTLADNDATAKRKLQEAENNFRMNQAITVGLTAKLKILGLSIEDIKKGVVSPILPVLAPFSGYVKTVKINLGSNFTPADVLFELISKQHLHIELKVFEKDAFKLKEKQTVVFNDPRIGGRVEGKIFLIGKTFEADIKAINVHVHLNNKASEQRLTPGQYLNAIIQTENRTANVLPEASILNEDNNKFVYIIDNQNDKSISFRKIAVQTGVIQDGKVEIISPATLKNVVVKRVNFLAGMGEETE